MAEENGTNQNNTENQQSGSTNQAPDNKMAETAKEIGGAAAALAEQGARAAKKKFDEAGGVEGIKEKSRKAAGEIKAGFVPDEGTTGYRRYTSSLKNLWVSGRTGKIAVLVGVILILYFVGSCFGGSDDMNEIKRSSSGRKLTDSSISERTADNTTSTRTTNTPAKKGFTVKGFYMGMSLDDAKRQYEKCIEKKCQFSDSTSNSRIIYPVDSDGWLFSPFATMEVSNNKLTELFISPKAVDIMFNVADMNGQSFAQAFADSYEIPIFEVDSRYDQILESIEMFWTYTHPDGTKIEVDDSKGLKLKEVASASERKFD